jgi:hypothetical protein
MGPIKYFDRARYAALIRETLDSEIPERTMVDYVIILALLLLLIVLSLPTMVQLTEFLHDTQMVAGRASRNDLIQKQ